MNSIGYSHLLAFILHTVSAILAFLSQPESGLTLGKLVVPEVDFKGSNKTLLVVETDHVVFEDINIVGLIFTNEIITAVSHLLGVIGFFLYTDAMMRDGRHLESVRRYVEYAVTAGLLEVALLVGMGSTSFYQVLFILLSNVAIQLMGYMSERTQDRMRQIYYSLGGFVLLAPSITVIVWNATLVKGMERVEELAYFYLALYVLFGVHNLFDHVLPFWRNAIDRDTGYNILSVATKIGLSWLLIAITFKTYKDAGVALEPTIDMDFVVLQDALRYAIIAFVVVGLALTAFVLPKPKGSAVAATEAEKTGLMATIA
ncbi:MAG: hypothetical protein CMO44_11490 [Verrucomicrobiales bacterium]|nr:hypothetical protein [Verrucomicrobiales bacterium]